jgi:hypothetical protein
MSESVRNVSSQTPYPAGPGAGAGVPVPARESAAAPRATAATPELKDSSVAALPGFLTWRAGDEVIRSACESYVEYIYYQLRRWSQADCPEVFSEVVRLPKSSQQRLLLAPGLFHLLQSTDRPGGKELEALKQFIRMEQHLCGQGAAPQGAAWAALGDYYLPAETGARRQPIQQASADWDSGRAYQAPVLNGVVLDAHSPAPAKCHPDYYGELGRHTPAEMAVIEPRLQESFAHILSVSPTAMAAVRGAVQVVALVRAPALTAGTHSFSTRSVIGKLGLVNLHTEPWLTYRISNAIIHESIHSLIYKLQLRHANALYTDEAAAERLAAVSPWSGRTLRLHSVVHACFVWFGLWSFWRLSPVRDVGTQTLQEKARRGFSSGSLLAGLSPEAHECIQPAARLAIEEMFERVNRDSH